MMKIKLTKHQIKRLNTDTDKYYSQLLIDADEQDLVDELDGFLLDLDEAAQKNKDKSFDVSLWLSDNIATSNCREAYIFAKHFQNLIDS